MPALNLQFFFFVTVTNKCITSEAATKGDRYTSVVLEASTATLYFVATVHITHQSMYTDIIRILIRNAFKNFIRLGSALYDLIFTFMISKDI